jgi:C4-dicarboxylate-specific signal transduction histidine kinase
MGKPYDGEHDIAQRIEYLAANGMLMDIYPTFQGLVLHQDEARLGRILTNLVRNVQHKKSRVIVQMALKKKNFKICVNDDGQGIVLEDQSDLF